MTHSLAAILCLCLALACAAGCNGAAASLPSMNALPNRETAELEPDDVVRIMLRSGFTDQEVMTYGTQLRNDLAMFGASQMRTGKKVRAIFAVQSNLIHVSTMTNGNFAYDYVSDVFR